MSAATAFTKLGRKSFPKVARKAFPDTCTITAEVRTAGTGGGRIKTVVNAYTNVPCRADPIEKFGWTKEQGDQLKQTQVYKIWMPTHHAGEFIDLGPQHRIVIAARGAMPARTFSITSAGNNSGIMYAVIANEEN